MVEVAERESGRAREPVPAPSRMMTILAVYTRVLNAQTIEERLGAAERYMMVEGRIPHASALRIRTRAVLCLL